MNWRAGVFLAAALCLCGTQTVSGATVSIGDHVLLPNTPGQQLPIYVSGGELIAGMDLYLEVGSGDFWLDPTIQFPKIADVDPLTEAIFGSNHTPPIIAQTDALWSVYLVTFGDTVPASGLLATLTFDTTGLPEIESDRVFPLGLDMTPEAGRFWGIRAGTMMYDQLGSAIPLIKLGGSLIIPGTEGSAVHVPEPSSVCLAGIAALAALLIRIGKRAHSSGY